jgi:L-alanine-DL-glutamate epimerase-like enolase superfamily enzyme
LGQNNIGLVHAEAGGQRGVGFTYADTATAHLIQKTLTPEIKDKNAMNILEAYQAMWMRIRNLGRPGIVSTAISAVDCALWDLKAKLLGVPLCRLLGQVREGTQIYGSGGFTSYTDKKLTEQLGGWADQGIHYVKMKIGRHPQRDPERVKTARQAIGRDVELYVDANGALSRKEALLYAEIFDKCDVTWFEEPVSSDDLQGLHLIRNRAPAGMDIAAGEYGYDIFYFRHMLEAEAVDVLQADVTRCGGITGWLAVAHLCEARSMPFSAHTAPSMHLHPCCSVLPLRNLEYFHDHVRIEHMFFDGVPEPVSGELRPDLSRPGFGIELKRADAARYAA